MNFEKIIIEKLSSTLAVMATNTIIEAAKAWRFYFDDNDRAKLQENTKIFIMEILENARK